MNSAQSKRRRPTDEIFHGSMLTDLALRFIKLYGTMREKNREPRT